MQKKHPEVDAIRDLIRNLGLLSKLIIEFIPALEGLMKTEADLKKSLDELTSSINQLTTAVAGLPPPVDLTPDVSVVDSLKRQVDAATSALTPPVAAAPVEPVPVA